MGKKKFVGAACVTIDVIKVEKEANAFLSQIKIIEIFQNIAVLMLLFLK